MAQDDQDENVYVWACGVLVGAVIALTILSVGVGMSAYMIMMLIPELVKLSQGAKLDPDAALEGAGILSLSLFLTYLGVREVLQVWRRTARTPKSKHTY